MVYITWFNTINVLLSIISLAVCFWAYRKRKRSGWFLLAMAGLIGLGAATVLPAIETARQKAWHVEHQLSPEAQKAFMEESNAVANKYYPAGGGPPPALPYRLDLLVSIIGGLMGTAGLWLIAQQEPRKDAEPSAGGNAAPPRASA